MRTGAGLGSVSSAELVKHPSAGSAEPLLVLLAAVVVSIFSFSLRRPLNMNGTTIRSQLWGKVYNGLSSVEGSLVRCELTFHGPF